MKKILLTYGLFATVSDEDFEEVNSHPWFVRQEGNFGRNMRFYAEREIIVNRRTKKLYMHREIMKPGPGLVVVHLNSDTLDNRRENLEVITRAESIKRNKAKGKEKIEYRRGKTRQELMKEAKPPDEPRPFEKEMLQKMNVYKKQRYSKQTDHKKSVARAKNERGGSGEQDI